MTEFKIISKEKVLKRIEKLSIEELNVYKIELHEVINNIDVEIKVRKTKKNIAEKFFRK